MPFIQFMGAAGTVTGSKFLVDAGRARFLIDCGMFQGAKKLRLLNWEPLPVRPAGIDQVFITHAHIDHIGMLPRLVRDGFEGPVWATPVTAELARLTLSDAAHLQEEDARFANKKGFSKHKPALPLYTMEDAERAIEKIRPLEYNEPVELSAGARVRFRDAGHILGSASVDAEIAWNGRRTRMIFSGDLGRYDTIILRDPAPGEGADYVVIESTYGNRKHPEDESSGELAEAIQETAKRGGMLLIPAFAVGRTQAILYLIRDLKSQDRIPDLPIYVDSPMAIAVTELFCRHIDEFDEEARAVFRETGECPLLCPKLQFARTPEESRRLNDVRYPCIVISASGMATGGRILHHLKHRLPDHRNTVLFVGFQAAGTRGRLLIEGARQVKIHGEHIPVRARIRVLESFSRHADYTEILRWLETFPYAPQKVFVVHGEPEASAALADRIRRSLRWETYIPEYLEKFELPR
ncbi:MAG: MBL fold metallo-hydrolase [Acidobacteria bacterium]|nr:MBL fold metallo-hydrolase [Acidobacteriota bacterium]